MAAQHDPDWLGSRKVGTKKKDPTVEVEGASYEFAVEVAFDDDLPNGAYAIPDFTPPHAIHFGTQKVFVPSSGPTYNDVVKPMMSKLREKIDAWFQPLKAQVDASNKANAFSIRMNEGREGEGGGKQLAYQIEIYLLKLEFKGGAVSADGAVRAGTHSATIQTHVRVPAFLSPTFHLHPAPDSDPTPRLAGHEILRRLQRPRRYHVNAVKENVSLRSAVTGRGVSTTK